MYWETVDLLKQLLKRLSKDEICALRKDKDFIDKNIEVLKYYIKPGNYSDNFFLEPDHSFYKKTIQERAVIIKNKIGLKSFTCPPITLTYNDRPAAGTFNTKFQSYVSKAYFDPQNMRITQIERKISDTPSFRIAIDRKYEDHSVISSSILVHELTNFYFYVKGIKDIFQDNASEEQCCDIAIFLLGLGKLLMNSFSEYIECFDDGKMIYAKPIDYLQWYYLVYVFEKVNIMNNISHKESLKNLNSDARNKLLTIRRYPDLFKS